MLSSTRSPARALARGVATLSLIVGGLSLASQARSITTHCQSAPSRPKLQVHEGSPWVGTFPRSLAVRGGASKVRQVATQEELEEILSNSGDALVVVDFTAVWCSPCQQIAPAFEQLSQELTNVVFLKVDVDENEETAQKYDVVQMPTFLLMRKGEVVDQFSGANAAVLRQKIESLTSSEEGGGAATDAGGADCQSGDADLEEEGGEEEEPDQQEACEPGAESGEDSSSSEGPTGDGPGGL